MVNFSPDGTQIISGSADNNALLWKVPKPGETPAQPIPLKGHTSSIYAVAFSPDGQTIATASGDRTVRLWRKDGTFITQLTGHGEGVYAVAFSPDGKTIASGSRDKTIRLWQQQQGAWKAGQTLKDPSAEITSLAFSPDGQLLATGGSDRAIKLWNVKDGTRLLIMTGHTGVITALAFNPGPNHRRRHKALLASVDEDGTIHVWKPDDGILLASVTGHTGPVEDIAFTPDGKVMVTASLDHSIRFWQMDSENTEIIASYRNHRNEVNAAAYNIPQQFIATAGNGTRIKLWQAKDKSGIETLNSLEDRENPSGAIWDLSMSLDGQLLASASEDNAIRLWDVSDPRQSKLFKRLKGPAFKGHEDMVYTVAFSLDGKWLASGSEDNTVRLWNRDGTLIRILNDPELSSQQGGNKPMSHAAPIWEVAIAPDAQTLASGSDDGTIKLWAKDGQLLQRIPGHHPEDTPQGHKATITGLAFSKDGKYMVSTGADNTVKLWAVEDVPDQNGKSRKHLRFQKEFFQPGLDPFRVAFSRDSHVVAVTTAAGMIELWDIQRDDRVSLKGHSKRTLGVAFASDNQLVSTGADSLALLWNIQSSLQNPAQEELNLVNDGCKWLKDYLQVRVQAGTAVPGESSSKKQVRQLCEAQAIGKP